VIRKKVRRVEKVKPLAPTPMKVNLEMEFPMEKEHIHGAIKAHLPASSLRGLKKVKE